MWCPSMSKGKTPKRHVARLLLPDKIIIMLERDVKLIIKSYAAAVCVSLRPSPEQACVGDFLSCSTNILHVFAGLSIYIVYIICVHRLYSTTCRAGWLEARRIVCNAGGLILYRETQT